MSKIVDFEDIGKNLPNGQNMGGLPQTVFYGSYEDVLSWPKRPLADEEGMTIAKMGELTGSLEMKEGKFMHRLYVTDGEGKLDIEGVGEVDGKSYVMKLRVYQPGLQSGLLGFINQVKNDNLVFIVPDSNGNLFLLGDEKRAAVLDSIDGMTTGQKTEERPGAGLVFSFKTANVYQYKGVIPLKEGGGAVPDPEPEPGPGKVMACCPDGINDYFTITDPAVLSALVPASGRELVYTIDLTDAGGAVFAFGVKDVFAVTLIYSGNFILLLNYAGGKTMGIYQEAAVENAGKRVLLKLVSSEQGMHLYVNGVEEALTFGDVSADLPRVPATDFFYLFRDNSESEPSYGACKLLSFGADQKTGENITPLVLWNFTGVDSVERMKNKVAGKPEFDLVAQNVLNIGEVIKGIEVEDLPEPAPSPLMACCPDGVDDYFTIATPSAFNVGLLFPLSVGQQKKFCMDMIPGSGMLFNISRSGQCYFGFGYTGSVVMARLAVNSKTFVVYQSAAVDNTGKRVSLELILERVADGITLGLSVNGVKEEIVPEDVTVSDNLIPSADYFNLFKNNEGDDPMPSDSKLISFRVVNVADGQESQDIIWDFKGETSADRLKNKVSKPVYNLVANNVADIDMVIKAIQV